MPSISLACYTVRARKKYAPDTYRTLDNLDENGLDLFDLFYTYLKARRQDLVHNEEQQKLLRVERLVASGRTLAGRFITGEYGYEADIFNVTRQEIVYNQEVDDARLLSVRRATFRQFCANRPLDSETIQPTTRPYFDAVFSVHRAQVAEVAATM